MAVIYFICYNSLFFLPRYSKPVHSVRCYSYGGQIKCYISLNNLCTLTKLAELVKVLVRYMYSPETKLVVQPFKKFQNLRDCVMCVLSVSMYIMWTHSDKVGFPAVNYAYFWH